MQIVGIIAVIAFFVFLVTSTVILTWTAIITFALIMTGVALAFLYFQPKLEAQQARADHLAREQHQRTLEIIAMITEHYRATGQHGGTTIDITPPKDRLKIGRRNS